MLKGPHSYVSVCHFQGPIFTLWALSSPWLSLSISSPGLLLSPGGEPAVPEGSLSASTPMAPEVALSHCRGGLSPSPPCHLQQLPWIQEDMPAISNYLLRVFPQISNTHLKLDVQNRPLALSSRNLIFHPLFLCFFNMQI